MCDIEPPEGGFIVEKLAVLLDLSRALSALITLDELRPCIIAKTKEVLEAESCALFLLDIELSG
jgi:hypothetical protein